MLDDSFIGSLPEDVEDLIQVSPLLQLFGSADVQLYASFCSDAGPDTGAGDTGPDTGAGDAGPDTGAGDAGPDTGAGSAGSATGAGDRERPKKRAKTESDKIANFAEKHVVLPVPGNCTNAQWGNSCSWVANTPIFNSKYWLRDLVAWINKCLGSQNNLHFSPGLSSSYFTNTQS